MLMKPIRMNMEGTMGTVEWSELLRWVPRAAQEDPGQEFRTPTQLEVPCQIETSHQAPAAKAETRTLTLASL
jgi:hypothetical protein